MGIPDYITASPLFFEMHENEIQAVVQECRVFEHKAGDYIIRFGDEGHSLFVVLSGEAIIEKPREGRCFIVQSMNAGDVFGEVSLMAQKDRQNNVIARKDSTLLEIPYDTIFHLYRKKPKVFGILILNIARLIGGRLSGAYEIIAQMQDEMEKSVQTG